jgi:ATP-binding cassette subfamily F protein 3
MLMHPANFLLLDEPTNHLDIAAREVLERALREFKGTLCLITHDRHLINAVANKVIEVNAGRLTIYPGNYEDYQYKKEREKEEAGMDKVAVSSSDQPEGRERAARRSKEQKRLEAEARNRFYRETQELRQKIQNVESNLEQATREMESMAVRLSDPEVYRKGENIPGLLKAHAEAKKSVESLTAEWETLAQRLEQLGKDGGER